MPNLDRVQHESLEIGPLPIVRAFLDRLELDQLLEQYLPRRRLGREPKLAPGKALTAMIANIVIARRPLYGFREWARHFVPEHFGLEADDVDGLNDDRLGRALDRMFEADRASLMTAVITRAVKTFEIDVKQLHCDTTTVTFSGAYEKQRDALTKDPPPVITFGHNKDHRPDLKQLVYALTVSADGAVPIHHKTYDGNTTDDQVHIETWSTLVEIVGHPRFLYVADSKLCTRENMTHIADRRGRFLTVLPATRSEYTTFCDALRQGLSVDWQEVRREPDPRGTDRDPIVYEAFEGDHSAEGYRVVWYRSSQKTRLDAQARTGRIEKAKRRLEALNDRVRPFKSEEAALQAAQAIVKDHHVERWLAVHVETHVGHEFKQTKSGRPSPKTRYRKTEIPFFVVTYEENGDAIEADARADGIFPLITNVKKDKLPPKQVLAKYKYQPNLEKRNEQLKSVYHVRPVLLHNPKRVTGLLFVYFLALLLWALIEREIRGAMKRHKIKMVPLYPELRDCQAPTTDGIFQALQGVRRHRLLDEKDQPLKTFYDKLSPAAEQCLELLGISFKPYGIEG